MKPNNQDLISPTPAEHLDKIARAIATELEPSDTFKNFAKGNSDILGAHAEAAVRRLIKRAVHPMRVSHGAVVDDKSTYPLRQLDAMLWMPFPAPAIFEVDDFALVPRSNVFGVMEIKTTGYRGRTEKKTGKKKGGDYAFDAFCNDARAHVSDQAEWPSNLHPGLGVICVLDRKPSDLLFNLMSEGKVVAIFDARNGRVSVSAPDVFILINYLQFVRTRFQLAANAISLSIPGATPPDRRATWQRKKKP